MSAALHDAYQPRHGRVHHGGHDTEFEAAASVRHVTGVLRKAVVELLREHPAGLTDEEGGVLMAQRMNYADRLTFGRRRQELVMQGIVVRSELKRVGRTGRRCVVWQLNPDVTVTP